MIRSGTCAVLSAFFVAFTGLALISAAVYPQPLPTNWEVRYTNLKDDLRALALDPLDPKVIFIGTNLAVVGSADGGGTWTSGESFRINKIPVSSADTPEAQELLLLIEQTGGRAAPAAGGPAGGGLEAQAEREAVQEEITEVTAEAGEKDDAIVAAGAEVKSLETQLGEAEQAVNLAEKDLKEAELALSQWTPDELSASDVAALVYTEEDYMDEDDYARLEGWLSDRGLAVPSDGHERQDILKNYLIEHAAAGDAVKDAVAAVKNDLDEGSRLVKDIEAKIAAEEAAGGEAQDTQAAAEKKLAELEDKRPPKSVEPAAGPAEVDEAAAETAAAEAGVDATGVTYIEFDPSSSDKIFLNTFDGVYRSADKGITWERVYTGLNPTESAGVSLAVDPSNPDTVFSGSLSGIARTTDGGKTWDRPVGLVGDKVITRVAVHPFDSKVVLAGAAGKGIFKSLDGGTAWELSFSKASQLANTVLSIKFAPSQPQVIYAGTMSGLYKSLDGGASWDTAIGMGLGGTVQVRDVIVSPTSPETVIIATDRGVFGSTNGGAQWRRLTFGLLYRGCNFLSFDPLDPATVWMITDNRVFKSAPPVYLDLSSGQPLTLAGCGDITLDGSERHSITIESIDEAGGVVTVVIQSEPRTIQVKVGESTEVDLNGDGSADLNLTLDSLQDDVPRFSLCRIAAAASPGKEKPAELIPPEQITGLEDLEPYFRAEPTWVEVQQAAARWAEVHPDKIAAWRRGASLIAFLPEVEFGFARRTREREEYDRSESYSYSTSYDEGNGNYSKNRRYTSNEFETAFTISATDGEIYEFEQTNDQFRSNETGTDSDEGYGESYGEDLGVSTGYRDATEKVWGLKFEWELGDFLYNTEQLRISREARDLVELRQDVLDQATLYFFDRRTARIDMILNPPADSYSRVEMLLQIQQLDASLDAMTGGYFTATIKEREKQFQR
ncbi:MAG: hypothetical protein V1789_03355 [PVC group bacterium]